MKVRVYVYDFDYMSLQVSKQDHPMTTPLLTQLLNREHNKMGNHKEKSDILNCLFIKLVLS